MEKTAKIITVTSMKGGVGKTTLSILLSTIYSNMGKKVLLMDLDLYNGNIAFAFNKKTKNNIYNFCDDFINNRLKNGITNDYFYNVKDNLDFIPAPKDPRDANKMDKRLITEILKNVKYLYDVIIIDTNHLLDICNMICFENSDRIFHIMSNDCYDLQNTKNFIHMCKNMEVDNLVLVLNESLNKNNNYFSNYDIKNVVKKNIDYKVPLSLHLNEFDKIIMDGDILNYYKYLSSEGKKDYNNFATNMFNLLEEVEK